jgi:hypothetical protein
MQYMTAKGEERRTTSRGWCVLYHLRERTDRRRMLPEPTNLLQHHPTIPVLLRRILHNRSGDLRVGAPCGLSAAVPRGLLGHHRLRLHVWIQSRAVGMWTW